MPSKSEGGTVWTCPGCNGRAEALAVLRRVTPAAFVQAVWTAARAPRDTRPCPFCRKPMAEIRVEGLVLDLCPPCQFVWFDPGERAQAPDSPRTPALAKAQREQDAQNQIRLREAVKQAKVSGQRDGSWVAAVLEGLLDVAWFLP